MNFVANLLLRGAKLAGYHPRDPALAAFLGRSNMSSAGYAVTPMSAMQLSAVYSCVRVLAETVAGLPLIMYRRTDKGRMRAVDHPWYRTLQLQPNTWQSSFEWREQAVAHIALRGAAYSRIQLVRGKRILTALNPDRVTAHLHTDGTLSYEYRQSNGSTITLLQEEVLRVPFMTLEGIKPLTPIEAQRETIGTALATNDFAARYFENDTKPPIWIEAPPAGFKDKEAKKKFREQWDEAQGGENRGKAPVMDSGFKIHEMSINASDAQLLESRAAGVIDICRIFRMPPHMIGALERATNNNVEQQAIDFVVHTMRPWFVRFEQALARDLLTEQEQEEYYFEFLVDGLLRGDSTARGEFYTKLFNIGAMSQDEIRAAENRDPLPDGQGQKFYVPLNMVSVDGKAGATPQEKTKRDEPNLPTQPDNKDPQ